jgi:hypothetical protein
LPEGAPATFWRPRSPYARGVIGATAIWTLASLGLCIWAHPTLLVIDGTIPCAAGAALGVYVLLRSLRFAAIAGLICAGAIVFSSGTLTVLGWLLPRAQSGAIWNFSGTFGVAFAIFVDGLVAAGLVLWQLRSAAADVSAGAPDEAAALSARDRTLGLGVASLLCVTAPVLLPLCREVRHLEFFSAFLAPSLAAIVGAAAVLWFCFVMLPLLIAGSGFSEQAIARINRRQEWFQRALTPVEFLLEPRWALSITGIAAILFALVFLDRVQTSGGSTVFAVLQIWNARAVTFYGTLLAILLIGVVWTRSWRKALSSAAAAVYSATVAAWFALRTGFVPPVDAISFDYFPFLAWEVAAMGSAASAALIFLFGSVSMASVRDVEDAQQSMTGALAVSAGAIICIAMTALLASALAFSAPGIVLAITSVLAALVLFPCFYVALNALLPRYRSTEEVFGRE